MDNRSYKEILYKKYDAFSLEGNEAKKKSLQSELQSILNKIDNHDSEDFYIWGLIYYISDEQKEYNKNIDLEKFIKAYQLDADNFLACLYVAHCFHDKKDFTNALNYYERVNQKSVYQIEGYDI